MSRATPAASSSSGTSSTTNSILSGLKMAASFVGAKTSEAIQHLKAPPKEITCAKCQNKVAVPQSLFDWTCGACTTINVWSAPSCSACHTVPASGNSGPSTVPQVTCGICHTINIVPSNNAKKHASTAAKVAKEMAQKASDYAKQQYAINSAVPLIFHCEHCNLLLENPNVSDQPPLYAEDETKAETKDAGTAESKLYKVTCPQCAKETTIPSTVAADKTRNSGFLVKRGVSKAYYMASDNVHVDCPNCKSAVVVQKKVGDKLEDTEHVERVEDNVYTAKCPKCTHEFAASIPAKKV